MTQEQKARAYDEALERARKMLNMILDNELLGFPDQIREIFPQLRESESEDERIRKALIKLMTVAGESYVMSATGFKKEQLLAYLERQKESLHIPETCKENADSFTDIKDRNIRGCIGMALADVSESRFKMYGVTLKECLAYLEKQKARPIPDKFSGLKSLMLQYFDSAVHRNDDAEIESDTDLFGRKILDYVWKYSDEQKEQKPWKVGSNAYFTPEQNPKWSEEDEKTFWGLTAYIPDEELERLGVTRLDILKKFKSLRPQPIQLKEAYKEGFQTARHAIALAFMNYLDENRPDGKMGLSNGEREDIDKAFKEGDWAKIIRYVEKYRPSWKPSEEKKKETLDGADIGYGLETAIDILENGFTHYQTDDGEYERKQALDVLIFLLSETRKKEDAKLWSKDIVESIVTWATEKLQLYSTKESTPYVEAVKNNAQKVLDWAKEQWPIYFGWKPSEEQMRGLAHAINLDVYDAQRYKLDTLYNDLKKL